MDFAALNRARRASIHLALALLAIETVQHCTWSTYKGLQKVLGLNERSAVVRNVAIAIADGLVERLPNGKGRKSIIKLSAKARKALGLEP